MSRSEPIVSLEAIGASDNRLRVDFAKDQDRYAHSIHVEIGDSSTLVMRSTEDRSNEVSPASPCFTELQEQDDILFLTGASTTFYWSMSVSVCETRFCEQVDVQVLRMLTWRQGLNAPTVRRYTGRLFHFLSFEVACRVKESGAAMCAQYQVAEHFKAIQGQPSPYTALVLDSKESAATVHLGQPPDVDRRAETVVHPWSDCLVTTDGTRCVNIGPPNCEPLVLPLLPATIQWRYGVWVL